MQGIGVERAGPDGVLEGEAVEKLHGDEGLRLVFLGQVLIDFVDGADVGMVQRGCGLRFALETSQGLGILGDFIGRNFRATKRRSLMSSAL